MSAELLSQSEVLSLLRADVLPLVLRGIDFARRRLQAHDQVDAIRAFAVDSEGSVCARLWVLAEFAAVQKDDAEIKEELTRLSASALRSGSADEKRAAGDALSVCVDLIPRVLEAALHVVRPAELSQALCLAVRKCLTQVKRPLCPSVLLPLAQALSERLNSQVQLSQATRQAANATDTSKEVREAAKAKLKAIEADLFAEVLTLAHVLRVAAATPFDETREEHAIFALAFPRQAFRATPRQGAPGGSTRLSNGGQSESSSAELSRFKDDNCVTEWSALCAHIVTVCSNVLLDVCADSESDTDILVAGNFAVGKSDTVCRALFLWLLQKALLLLRLLSYDEFKVTVLRVLPLLCVSRYADTCKHTHSIALRTWKLLLTDSRLLVNPAPGASVGKQLLQQQIVPAARGYTSMLLRHPSITMRRAAALAIAELMRKLEMPPEVCSKLLAALLAVHDKSLDLIGIASPILSLQGPVALALSDAWVKSDTDSRLAQASGLLDRWLKLLPCVPPSALNNMCIATVSVLTQCDNTDGAYSQYWDSVSVLLESNSRIALPLACELIRCARRKLPIAHDIADTLRHHLQHAVASRNRALLMSLINSTHMFMSLQDSHDLAPLVEQAESTLASLPRQRTFCAGGARAVVYQ
ncbi:MAG: hypothetical protein MHM6MM_004741 [Cercozoa sp. M6MM]